MNNPVYIYESERLKFRRIGIEDYDDLAEMLTDPEVMYAWEHTFTREQIIEWIDRQLEYYHRDGVGYFAAASKDTEEIVGQIGLHYSDFQGNRVLEVCYMLKKRFWNQGYALEGAKAWLDYAKEQLGVNEAYAFVRTSNPSSMRVAEKAGMHRAGTFVKHYNGMDMEHFIYLVRWKGEC
ncbi:GNAT family N-acetyltransferase [Paenibacillus sp. TAB 01]|uniref:GNAT family N-acetyltransferase n=1 Tax=Paenibacillus sp. TAB 01 TaxID=3368988 RepID=UPI003752ED37